MAPRKKAAAKDTAPEFAEYVEKEPSASTQLFVDWLEEHTGYEVDPTSVKLARALVGAFQKSDVNQERLNASREAKEQLAEERAAKKAEREKAKAEKAAAPKKRTSKKAAATEDDGEAEPATKKAAPAKKTAAAPRRRRRAPAGV